MQVKVIGAREAAASLERLAEQAEDLDSLRTVGEQVQQQLEGLSPRLTGRLAESWQVADLGENKVQVGSDLIYASVLNYGSPGHHIEARRFVQTAATRAEQQIEQAVTDELNGLIARM